jgi:hypothetical protein
VQQADVLVAEQSGQKWNGGGQVGDTFLCGQALSASKESYKPLTVGDRFQATRYANIGSTPDEFGLSTRQTTPTRADKLARVERLWLPWLLITEKLQREWESILRSLRERHCNSSGLGPK